MVLDLDSGLGLLTAMLPELILTVWAMLLLLHTAWRHKQPGIQRQVGWLAVAGLIVAIVATIWLWRSDAQLPGLPATLALDAFRWAVSLIVLLGSLLTTVLSIGYLDREGIDVPEYHVLVLLATVGMLFMAAGADLLVIFLGLETMSVCVYVLAGINRKSAFSAEAALKYFLLGAFASAFLLYGIALLYGATGTSKLSLIGFAAARPVPGLRVMLGAGVALIIVGFGFKIAAVPFHMWAPDVYDGSPTPTTAFMAATVKAAAFGALVRVLLVALIGTQPDWWRVVWWLATITMVGGNLLALAQRSLKRMLAYSSVAHAGYLLAALVAGSPAGAAAFLFYLLFYTLATVGAFAVVIAKGRAGERDVTLDDLAGLSETHPLLAAVMAISMLSLMGFPGTAGFIGKWYILLAATGGGYTSVAVVLVLTSVVSAGYYLPVIMAMYMKPRVTERAHEQTGLPNVVRGMLALALAALVFFGVYPSWPLGGARLGGTAFMPRMMTARGARPGAAAPLPPGHPGGPGTAQPPEGHPGAPPRALPPGHPGAPGR